MTIPTFPTDLGPTAVLIVLAAFLAGLSRGFSGFGAALVFVPVASAVVGPVVALPVLLLADAATSSRLILASYRECTFADVRAVLMGALVGFPIGAQILTATDPVAVRWAITVMVLASLAVMVSGVRYAGKQGGAVAAAVGCVSGLMSGLAQIGGPPVVIYWLGTGISAARMRANLIVYFAIMMGLGLIIFAAKGLLSGKVIWLAFAAAPGYALGVYLGVRMFPLASPTTFRWIAMGLVAFAAISGMPALDPILRGSAR